MSENQPASIAPQPLRKGQFALKNLFVGVAMISIGVAVMCYVFDARLTKHAWGVGAWFGSAIAIASGFVIAVGARGRMIIYIAQLVGLTLGSVGLWVVNVWLNRG